MSADISRQQTTSEFGRHSLASVHEMRERARRHLERGAVTEDYKADRSQVVKILNEVLATELICMLRYKSHYYRACGINSEAVKPELRQHAQEAQQHAEMVAARIVQLNGAPNFNPEGLTARSRTEYTEPATLTEMIKEDLVSERIAVEFYTEIIYWLGDGDLTTRKLMQDILAVEAEHAEDMRELLGKLNDSQNSLRSTQGAYGRSRAEMSGSSRPHARK
jgi:bacterioferritin